MRRRLAVGTGVALLAIVLAFITQELWAIALATFAVLAGLGLILSWPTWDKEQKRAEIGASLLTGAILALTVGAVQFVNDQRIRDLEKQDEAQFRKSEASKARLADRQNLQLTIGLREKLVGIDLRGKDLTGFYLRGKSLRRADLRGAILDRADLTGSDLTGALLNNARLRGAKLAEADLRSANLSGVNAKGASFLAANLSYAVAADANFAKSSFSIANLSYALFPDSDLTEASLGGSVVRGTTFEGAKLKGAQLNVARYDAKTLWPPSYTRRVRADAPDAYVSKKQPIKGRSQVEIRARAGPPGPADTLIMCGNSCFTEAGRSVRPPSSGTRCGAGKKAGTWTHQYHSAVGTVFRCK